MRLFTLVISASALLIAGCADWWGSASDRGDIIIESRTGVRFVYLVRNSKFQADVLPQLSSRQGTEAQKILNEYNALPAQGYPTRIQSGIYQMIYFCGEQVRTVLVQVIDSPRGTSVQKLQADCP